VKIIDTITISNNILFPACDPRMMPTFPQHRNNVAAPQAPTLSDIPISHLLDVFIKRKRLE